MKNNHNCPSFIHTGILYKFCLTYSLVPTLKHYWEPTHIQRCHCNIFHWHQEQEWTKQSGWDPVVRKLKKWLNCVALSNPPKQFHKRQKPAFKITNSGIWMPISKYQFYKTLVAIKAPKSNIFITNKHQKRSILKRPLLAF